MVKISPRDVAHAADVIEEVSRMYEYVSPMDGSWSAEELRGELPHIEAKLAEENLLDEVTDKIMDVLGLIGGADRIKDVLRGYEIDRPQSQFVGGAERC